MILYVLLLCAFAVATTEFVLVGLLPEIAADLAVSLPTAGLLVTAYMLVVTVGGPLAVVLTRGLPRRGLLAGTMTLALGSAALSARAETYVLLLGARLGSALAQALFVAVASQVAMAAVPPARQTAAVARVFNGFALATVAGLPAGTLVGQVYGWQAAFGLVAALSAVGLAGILVFCPDLPPEPTRPLARSLVALLRWTVLFALLTTLLALTGFVTVFTYVAPMLRELAGLGDVGVSAALVVYGLGTLAGTALAGRVHPRWIVSVLPWPLVVLVGVLATHGILLRHGLTAALSLFLLGASAFVVVPLIQTWLMDEVGTAAAGLAGAVNISVSGLAAALGAGLGGAIISAGFGLEWVSAAAAVPALGAVSTALALRRTSRPPSNPHPALGVQVPEPPAHTCPVDAASSC